MSAWVGGIRRGVPYLRKPIGIGIGLGIAVRIGRADRGYRAPEIVRVLGIVEGDDPVCKGHVQQGKQASTLRSRQLMLRGDGLRDLVPIVLYSAIPKAACQCFV